MDLYYYYWHLKISVTHFQKYVWMKRNSHLCSNMLHCKLYPAGFSNLIYFIEPRIHSKIKIREKLMFKCLESQYTLSLHQFLELVLAIFTNHTKSHDNDLGILWQFGCRSARDTILFQERSLLESKHQTVRRYLRGLRISLDHGSYCIYSKLPPVSTGVVKMSFVKTHCY